MLTYLPSRYYKDSQKILGNTYGMLVLQDFEAITPNLLARTIETVEGGGLVVLILKTMSSLKQLYTMTMVSVAYNFPTALLLPATVFDIGRSREISNSSPRRRCRSLQRALHLVTRVLRRLHSTRR